MTSFTDTKWHWPDDNLKSSYETGHSTSTPISTAIPGAFREDPVVDQESRQKRKPEQSQSQGPKPARSWPPRTCRICLETVLPTYHPASTSIPGLLQPTPSVTYESDDPAAGRLIRPYYGKRNYWECPTCRFRYRLERMRWGRAISSTATQLVLTVSIFFIAMFILGFVADPIINLYLDPYSTLFSGSLSKLNTKIDLIDDDEATWTEHFIKGLASLGLLSFVKVLFALSPWQWWNLRSSGLMGNSGRTGGTGRDRLASISWLVVLIGIGTFLYGVWKGVRHWSRRTLEKASERVMDVPLADDEDEFEE
ncbi:hypothetical protein MMC30_003518 [Trapelia coarctata]|nr:hypothetical protein [Trapelia coarctata]